MDTGQIILFQTQGGDTKIEVHLANETVWLTAYQMTLSGKELLAHAGTVSAEVAKLKADTEYDRFRERTKYQLSPVEIHFLETFEAEQKRL